jgi:hypothetical protein
MSKDGAAFPPPRPRAAPAAPTPIPKATVVARRAEPPAESRVAVARPRFEPTENEPDVLARALGPGKMPRLLIAHPRLGGLALLAAGGFGATEVARIASEGGVYLRALPAVTTIALCLGLWFLVVGRPRDTRGYAPDWWNMGYVGVLVFAGLAAIIVHIAWL